MERLRGEATGLSARVQSLESDRAALEAERADLEARVRGAGEQAGHELQQLMAARAALEARVAALQSTVEECTTQTATANSERDAERAARKAAEQQAGEVRRQADEARAHKCVSCTLMLHPDGCQSHLLTLAATRCHVRLQDAPQASACQGANGSC